MMVARRWLPETMQMVATEWIDGCQRMSCEAEYRDSRNEFETRRIIVMLWLYTGFAAMVLLPGALRWHTASQVQKGLRPNGSRVTYNV